jgi:hypothetical protein
MSRRCTSKARHSSATSLGRERDRPVRFSIRRNRWRTVFGWQMRTSAAPPTDASVSCHTRNVSNRISRSSSGRSPKPSNATPTVLIITSGALTAAVASREPSNTATEDVESVGPVGLQPCTRFDNVRASCLRVGNDTATCRFGAPARRVCSHRDTSANPAARNTTGSIGNIPSVALSISRSFPRVLTGSVSGQASAVATAGAHPRKWTYSRSISRAIRGWSRYAMRGW